MNETRVLLFAGALASIAAVIVLPPLLKKQQAPKASTALSAQGPRVADPSIAAAAEEAPSQASSNTPSAPSGSPVPSASELSDPAKLAATGDSLMTREQFEAAIPYYRKALEAAQDPDVMTALALCLRRTGNVPEAIELFKRSLSLKPDGLEARYYLGLTQEYDLADFDAAIETLETLVPRWPKEHADDLNANLEYMKRVRENLLRRAANSAPPASPATQPAEAKPTP